MRISDRHYFQNYFQKRIPSPADSRIIRTAALSRIIKKDGKTTPRVATNAPKSPPCEEPIKVAILTAIDPGVDSETAVTEQISIAAITVHRIQTFIQFFSKVFNIWIPVDSILERQPLPEAVESTQKKELKDGEHVAFVGPSGGGKTTGNLHHMMETQMQSAGWNLQNKS